MCELINVAVMYAHHQRWAWLTLYAKAFAAQTGYTLAEAKAYGDITAKENGYDFDVLLSPADQVSEDLSCWDD